MIQSPLMPKIALLASAGTKALWRGAQPVNDPKSLVIKSNILCLINNLLRQSFANVYVEVMHSVVYLVVLEVIIPIQGLHLSGSTNYSDSGTGANIRACGLI
jgi:hypothetical protein